MVQSSSVSKTGYATLTPFLHQQGRSHNRVLGDGNCPFRAFSRSLTGVEDHHLDIRKAIAQCEEVNRALFSGLHAAIISKSDRTFTQHLKNIKKQFVWGTTLEIIAAASLFELDVYIATETYRVGFPTWLVYAPRPVSNRRWLLDQLESKLSVTNKRSWIELLHVSGCHFDSIKALQGQKISRPKLDTHTDTSTCTHSRTSS